MILFPNVSVGYTCMKIGENAAFLQSPLVSEALNDSTRTRKPSDHESGALPANYPGFMV